MISIIILISYIEMVQNLKYFLVILHHNDTKNCLFTRLDFDSLLSFYVCMLLRCVSMLPLPVFYV